MAGYPPVCCGQPALGIALIGAIFVSLLVPDIPPDAEPGAAAREGEELLRLSR